MPPSLSPTGYTKPAGEVGTHYQLTGEQKDDGSLSLDLFDANGALIQHADAPAGTPAFSFTSPGGDGFYMKAFGALKASQTWNVDLGVGGNFSVYMATGIGPGGNQVINVRRDGGSVAGATVFGGIVSNGSLTYTDSLNVTQDVAGPFGFGAYGSLMFQGTLNGSLSLTYDDGTAGAADNTDFTASVRTYNTATGSFNGTVNGDRQGGSEQLTLNVFGNSLTVNAQVTSGPGSTVSATPNVAKKSY